MKNDNGMCENDLVKLNKYMNCVSMFNKVHTEFYEIFHHKISEVGDTSAIKIGSHLWDIIYQIGLSKKISAGNICIKLNVSQQNLQHNFRKLEEDGIIESNSHIKDKRVRILSLTKKGKIIFEKIQKICLEHIHEIGDTVDQVHVLMQNINAFYTTDKKTFNKE